MCQKDHPSIRCNSIRWNSIHLKLFWTFRSSWLRPWLLLHRWTGILKFLQSLQTCRPKFFEQANIWRNQSKLGRFLSKRLRSPKPENKLSHLNFIKSDYGLTVIVITFFHDDLSLDYFEAYYWVIFMRCLKRTKMNKKIPVLANLKKKLINIGLRMKKLLWEQCGNKIRTHGPTNLGKPATPPCSK